MFGAAQSWSRILPGWRVGGWVGGGGEGGSACLSMNDSGTGDAPPRVALVMPQPNTIHQSQHSLYTESLNHPPAAAFRYLEMVEVHILDWRRSIQE